MRAARPPAWTRVRARRHIEQFWRRQLQNIAVDNLDVILPRELLREHRHQLRVGLHRDDAPGARSQRRGQRPHAGADLQHRVVRRQVGLLRDATRRGRRYQKVLPQRFARG